MWTRPVLLLSYSVFAATVDGLFDSVAAPAEFYAAFAVWLAAALAFWAFSERYDGAWVYRCYVGFLLFELAESVYVFHLLGGMDWVAFVSFIFLMSIASFTVTPRVSYGIAVIAAVAIIAVAGAEAQGWIAHRDPFSPAASGRGLYSDSGYVVITTGVILISCLGLLTLVLQWMTRQLHSRQRALEAANVDLRAVREEALRSRQELADLNVTLEWRIAEQTREVEALVEIGKIVNSSLDLSEVHTEFARALRRLIEFDVLTIALVADETQNIRYLRVRVRVDDDGAVDSGFRETPSDGSLIRWVIESERRAVFGDIEKEFFFAERDLLLRIGFRSMACAPLFAKGRVVGTLSVMGRRAAMYGSEALDLMEKLAEPLGLAAENAALYEEANRRALREAALGAIARAISSNRQLRGLYVDILEQIGLATPFDEAVVVAAHDDGSLESYVIRPDTLVAGDFTHSYSDSELRDEGASRLGDDLEFDQRSAIDTAVWRCGYRASVRVPIFVKGSWAGLVMLNSRRAKTFCYDDLQLLEEVTQLLGLAFESASLYDELLRNAETDALTGLKNHRSMATAMEREAARARRSGRGFALLVIDIDNFKVFNDMLGHQVGDRVLRDVARVLTESGRESDIVARLGGDEFHVVLPETDVEQAVTVAERVRKRMKESGVSYPGQRVTVTLSIGVATFPAHGDTVEEVVRVADAAMYEVKRAGGNGVRVGSEVTVSRESGEGGRAVSFGLLEMMANGAAQITNGDSHVPPEAVAQTAVSIAKELGLPEENQRALRVASLGHRMGLFNERFDGSQWDQLSAGEQRLISERMEMGKLFMTATPLVAQILDAAYYHHRDVRDPDSDGEYAHELPLLARVLAVAEAYVECGAGHASPSEAFDHMRSECGERLDPEVVEALGRWLKRDRGPDMAVA